MPASGTDKQYFFDCGLGQGGIATVEWLYHNDVPLNYWCDFYREKVKLGGTSIAVETLDGTIEFNFIQGSYNLSLRLNNVSNS